MRVFGHVGNDNVVACIVVFVGVEGVSLFLLVLSVVLVERGSEWFIGKNADSIPQRFQRLFVLLSDFKRLEIVGVEEVGD